MSRVSQLMKLPGVVASGVFSRKGVLEDFEGPFQHPEASSLMHLCSSVTIAMEMQGRLLSILGEEPGWDACHAWIMWGPEMSLVAVHDSMCVVQVPAASFQEVIKAMRMAAGVEENNA